MPAVTPPFRAIFGSGAPTGAAPASTIYFDTANNMTGYIGFSGRWKPFSQGGAPSLPTVMQSGINTGNITGITLGSAPTQGNILVALVTHAANNITPGSGWTALYNGNGAVDGVSCFTKTAGAGESATQNSNSAISSGVIAMFEVQGGLGIVDTSATSHDVAITTTITQAITTNFTNEILLCLFTNNNTSGLTTPSNFTSDHTIASNGRSGICGHETMASAGALTLGATAGAAGTGTAQVVAIR